MPSRSLPDRSPPAAAERRRLLLAALGAPALYAASGPALGGALFGEALARAPGSAVEIVCGQGPWESHEASLGAFRAAAPVPVDAAPAAATAGAAQDAAPPGTLGGWPLLGGASPLVRPTGQQLLALQLDDGHLYLQEHVIDGVPVLPAAVALETVAEAVQSLWPGWQVVEVAEFRLLKGVELRAPQRALQVLVEPPPYGSSAGFEVNVALQSPLAEGKALTHYRGVVRLEPVFPAPPPAERQLHDERSLGVRQAYDEWLFHGPRFQLIERIAGLSERGAEARVRCSAPAQWLAGAGGAAHWLFDPGLLDVAAQMAWLWARAFRGESALPARFGRVQRFGPARPQVLTMHYARLPTDDPSRIRANVQFVDDAGQVVLAIDELDSIASAALNRLGGTAREGRPA